MGRIKLRSAAHSRRSDPVDRAATSWCRWY